MKHLRTVIVCVLLALAGSAYAQYPAVSKRYQFFFKQELAVPNGTVIANEMIEVVASRPGGESPTLALAMTWTWWCSFRDGATLATYSGSGTIGPDSFGNGGSVSLPDVRTPYAFIYSCSRNPGEYNMRGYMTAEVKTFDMGYKTLDLTEAMLATEGVGGDTTGGTTGSGGLGEEDRNWLSGLFSMTDEEKARWLDVKDSFNTWGPVGYYNLYAAKFQNMTTGTAEPDLIEHIQVFNKPPDVGGGTNSGLIELTYSPLTNTYAYSQAGTTTVSDSLEVWGTNPSADYSTKVSWLRTIAGSFVWFLWGLVMIKRIAPIVLRTI